MSKEKSKRIKLSALRNLFGKKTTTDETEVQYVESPEAAALSSGADKLVERPREMILPPLAPKEHIVEEGALPPMQVEMPEVSESDARAWRQHFTERRGAKLKRKQEASALEVATQRPIRLFIGYVPDVTEKDARFFAMGVAEKNVDSEYISYLDLFKFGTGYAYEIQEGGHGHSYLSSIIKYFAQLPPGLHDAETAVFIATTSRMVQVEKGADGGLVCIQLPESYKAKETEWLRPDKKLKLLRDQNSGLMMICGAFLGVSLLALAGAYLTRYVPIEDPSQRAWYDTVSIDQLPISQWDSLVTEAEQNHYVKALRFDGKNWCRKTDVGQACGKEGKPPGPIVPSTPGAPAASTGAASTPGLVSPASTAVPAPAAQTQAPPLPPPPLNR
jgi:hypothetical protein